MADPYEDPGAGFSGGDGLGDLFNWAKNLIPGAGSSGASPYTSGGFSGSGQYGPSEVPADVTDWWGAENAAKEAARKAEIQRAYETPEQRQQREMLDKQLALQIQQTNTAIAYQQAQIEKLQREASDETSPERKRLLDLQIQQVEASIKKSELDYQNALGQMPEQKRIELVDKLARERDAAKMQFDLQQTALSTGVALRGQDIQQMKAQDDFVMQMLQAQISAGRLSLDAATKKFDQWLTQKRLPSQIMESVSNSIQPFLPYMTDLKSGQVRPGFEKGGSMDVMTRLGGNKPGSYDQDKFKVNTKKVDLYSLARKAGADFNVGAAPSQDYEQFIPKVDLSQIQSRFAQGVAGPDQYMNAARGLMQGGQYTPPQAAVGAPPDGGGPTPSMVSSMVPQEAPGQGPAALVGDDEYERLRQAVAGGLE